METATRVSFGKGGGVLLVFGDRAPLFEGPSPLLFLFFFPFCFQHGATPVSLVMFGL
jgi:hypothetical protein